MGENIIITIARGLGSGGSHIGKALAAEYGIKYYDEEILQMASELSGINEQLFFASREKINKGEIAISRSKGIYKGYVYPEGDRRFLSDENLFNYQAEVMKNIALTNKESCVIIGKAANYVLRGLKNVIKINIQASDEYCMVNVMKRQLKTEFEAFDLIKKTNKYRADYYKYYTGRQWLDPREYDLSVNTSYIGEENATRLIIDYINNYRK